jgi:hypothetical protein
MTYLITWTAGILKDSLVLRLFAKEVVKRLPLLMSKIGVVGRKLDRRIRVVLLLVENGRFVAQRAEIGTIRGVHICS